jgi:hypothetical protein
MSKSSSITDLKELSAAIVGLVAGTAPSLVSVSSGRSRSSGFVWRPGLIVTADEALSEDGELTVKHLEWKCRCHATSWARSKH